MVPGRPRSTRLVLKLALHTIAGIEVLTKTGIVDALRVAVVGIAIDTLAPAMLAAPPIGDLI